MSSLRHPRIVEDVDVTVVDSVPLVSRYGPTWVVNGQQSEQRDVGGCWCKELRLVASCSPTVVPPEQEDNDGVSER